MRLPIEYDNQATSVRTSFEIAGKSYGAKSLIKKVTRSTLKGTFTRPAQWEDVGDQLWARFHVANPTTQSELNELMTADPALFRYLCNTAYNLYYMGIVASTLTALTLGKKSSAVVGYCSTAGDPALLKRMGENATALDKLFDELILEEEHKEGLLAALNK